VFEYVCLQLILHTAHNRKEILLRFDIFGVPPPPHPQKVHDSWKSTEYNGVLKLSISDRVKTPGS